MTWNDRFLALNSQLQQANVWAVKSSQQAVLSMEIQGLSSCFQVKWQFWGAFHFQAHPYFTQWVWESSSLVWLTCMSLESSNYWYMLICSCHWYCQHRISRNSGKFLTETVIGMRCQARPGVGLCKVAAISSQTEKIELEEGAQTDRRRESIRMFFFFAKIYFGNPAMDVSVFYYLIVQHLWFPAISLLNQKKSLI